MLPIPFVRLVGAITTRARRCRLRARAVGGLLLLSGSRVGWPRVVLRLSVGWPRPTAGQFPLPRARHAWMAGIVRALGSSGHARDRALTVVGIILPTWCRPTLPIRLPRRSLGIRHCHHAWPLTWPQGWWGTSPASPIPASRRRWAPLGPGHANSSVSRFGLCCRVNCAYACVAAIKWSHHF
jgi:hypothetical protein